MTSYTTFSDDGFVTVDIPPTIEVFDPPDDRYLPGYRITDNVTGDVKEYGPRLKDLNVPFSLYGLPIPITYGVRRLYGNIIWAQPLKEVVKKDTDGGKGGPTSKLVTYEYFANFAVSLGIAGNTDPLLNKDVIRMYANTALVYDRRGTGLLKWPRLYFTFHPGGPDQVADTHMESYEGVGNVPAYRDIMYIVFKDFPVGEFGNFIPSISAEIGDAVTSAYTITNIDTVTNPYSDPPNSVSTTDWLVDWDQGEYYAVTGGTESVVRTFDLESGECLGISKVNVGGVGWDENRGPVPPYHVALPTYTKGISTNFNSVGYIPWLNVITGKPSNLNTAEPFMLVDPFTGTVIGWCGADQFVGLGLNPSGPGAPQPFNDGYIPQWDYSFPLRVYTNLTDFTTTVIVQSISSFGGDLTYINAANPSALRIQGWETNFGYCKCFCEGQHRLNETDVYAVKGDYIYKAIAAPDGIIGAWTLYYSPSYTPHSLYYMEADNSLIMIFTNNKARKLTIDEEGAYTLTWEVDIAQYSSVNQYNNYMDNVATGYLAWCDAAGIVYELDLVFGAFKEYHEALGSYRPRAASTYCDPDRGRIVGFGSVLSSGTGESDTTKSCDDMQSTLYYGRAGDDRMSLALFLRGMALYAGYTNEQIDIDDDIDDMIDGAIIANVTTFKTIIQNVCTAYKIDYFESGGVIHFVRKTLNGSPDDFTLTEVDYLRATPSSAPEEPTIMIRREEEVSVPQVVQVRYLDKSLGYQLALQTASRSSFIKTNNSSEQLMIDVPIIMTADEAKLLATRALWGAWTSRVSYSIRTTKKWAKIEPGDFGTIQYDTNLFTCRVIQVTFNSDFTISIQAANAISDFAITVVADAGNGSGVDVIIKVPAKVNAFPMDLPLLSADDDLASTGSVVRMYWALAARPHAGWSGGSLYLGRSNKKMNEFGSTKDAVLQLRVISASDAPNWQAWDEEGEIVVKVRAGDPALLSSHTRGDVADGANMFAYGAPGRWEIVSFTDLTDNGNGTYSLTGLLRGQRGTHIHIDNHETGDSMIMLSGGDIQRGELQNSDINTRYVYKAANLGQSTTNVPARSFDFKGYAGQCLPVSGLKIERTIGDDDSLVISWRRRSRYCGTMIDGAENAALTAGELNQYLVRVYRWRHYDTYTWSGSEWVGSDAGVDADYVEFEVSGTSLALTKADIKAADLYSFRAPDSPSSFGSTFSKQAASIIAANASENEQIVDLGFNQFVAFRYLDVLVRQKNAAPGAPTWGPGMRQRIIIRDL